MIAPIDISSPDSLHRLSANPLLGYDMRPNHRSKDAPLPMTNSHGLRDVERDVAKPPGVTRVIVLGDSVVFGQGLNSLHGTIPAQLQNLYRGGQTEVLNFGTGGYSTLQEAELLRSRGLRFDPDTVVVVFTENDFSNFSYQALRARSNRARPALVDSLFRHSHLFRLASVRLNLLGYREDADPMKHYLDTLRDDNVPQGFKRLRSMADEHGFDLVLLIWPRFTDSGIVDAPFMPESDELVIEHLARMHGVYTFRLSEYLNVRPEDRGSLNPRLRYTLYGDGMHPTARLGAITAEVIKQILDSLASKGRPPIVNVLEAEPSTDDRIALGVARKLARTMVDEAYYLVATGHRLRAEGAVDEAIDAYKRALQVNPQHFEAKYCLASTLMLSGRTDEAILQFREALQRFPNSFEILIVLGWLLATHPDDRLRDADEAVELARRAVRLTHRRNAVALDVLAAAYAEAGQFEQARQAARAALQLVVQPEANPLAGEIIKRLTLYEQRRPYRQSPGEVEDRGRRTQSSN